MSGDETGSLLTSAGIGGAAVCCAALEAVGGVAIIAGLATTLGVAANVAYLVAIGLGGLLAAALVYGYRSRFAHV